MKIQMREDCEIEMAKQDIEFEKIKAATWNNMVVHLKSVNGLQNEIIVFNYHMRKEDVKEKMLINKIIDLRKIEIRDKIERQ